MSDKDEQPEVEGHRRKLYDDELDRPSRPSVQEDDDDTPDFEGHRHSRSPVRRHSRKPSKPS